MIKELATAIYNKYNTLTISGSALSSVAPLYYAIAPDKADYPFTSYYIMESDAFVFDTCSDLYEFSFQFSTFDSGTSPIQVMEIVDVINSGFSGTTLTSIGSGNVLITIDPRRVAILEPENEDGHQGVTELTVSVQKTR